MRQLATGGPRLTRDLEPDERVGGLGGDDPDHVGHRVALHDGEVEGILVEGQRLAGGLGLGDPLHVQPAGGPLLRPPVVRGFDLWQSEER